MESLQGLTTRTRLTLTVTDRAAKAKDSNRRLSLDDVANLFAAPLRSGLALTGQFKRTAEGETWTYEQAEVETDSACLQVVFDTLYNLSEAWSQIIALGGEVIPILQASAGDPNHPARSVAAQLIQAIAPTTVHLHQQGEARLVCPRCLRRCTVHEVKISWLSSIVYYGCRGCHQSKDFLTIETVIAVLDEQAGSEPVQQGVALTVNWLARQSLFDFDSVAIVRATDEQVERFVVEVGNDTDPTRQALYRTMRCVVSPNCRLADNTMRILQRTFGQVDVTEVSPASQEQRHIAAQLLDQEDERLDTRD